MAFYCNCRAVTLHSRTVISRPKMILKGQLVKIRPFVGLFEARVGNVLINEACVKALVRLESIADTNLAGKLEVRTVELVAQRGARQVRQANPALEISALEGVLLQAEYRRKADLEQVPVFTGQCVAPPITCIGLPESAEMPVLAL